MTTTTTTTPGQPAAPTKSALFNILLGGAFAGVMLFIAGFSFRIFGGANPDPNSVDARIAKYIYFGILVVPFGLAISTIVMATRAERRDRVSLVALGLTIIVVLALPFMSAFLSQSQ